ARHRARELAALAADGALGAPARAGARIRARSSRRARRHDRCHRRELRAPARRHGAVRSLADLQLAQPVRRRRREPERAARPGDGSHRLGLECRVDGRAELMEPALRLGASLGVAPAASAFLISLAGYAVAALLLELFLRPDPLAIARQLHETVSIGHAAQRARALGEILTDVRVQLALATLTISQFVMISTTSTSPVYLHDHGH